MTEGWTDGSEDAVAGRPWRRGRSWSWLIAVVVVAALAVVAWFLGEWIARDIVTKTVRQTVVTTFALPADQDVRVEVAGQVLPQLVSGTLEDVRVSTRDASIGGVTADVAVDLKDVRYREGGAMSAGVAVVTLDERELRALLDDVDGIPAASIGLASPDVTATTKLSAFGATVPIGLSLTPGASHGALVLSPAAFTLGGATISAADLRARFGSVADAVLRDRTVCIADDLPKGLTLSDVRVTDDRLVSRFEIDGRIAVDPSLQQKGTCA